MVSNIPVAVINDPPLQRAGCGAELLPDGHGLIPFMVPDLQLIESRQQQGKDPDAEDGGEDRSPSEHLPAAAGEDPAFRCLSVHDTHRLMILPHPIRLCVSLSRIVQYKNLILRGVPQSQPPNSRLLQRLQIQAFLLQEGEPRALVLRPENGGL